MKRTIKAALFEKLLKIAYSTYRNYLKEYNKKLQNGESDKVSEKRLAKFGLSECSDYNLYTLEANKENKEKIIIYFHGGCYVTRPCNFHYRFLKILKENSNYRIIIPFYPNAPFHNIDESLKEMVKVYKKVLEEYKLDSIVFMGDSSGASLLISLLMYLDEINLPKPNKNIVISPWLDGGLTNPEISKYQKHDPMLTVKAPRIIANKFKGDLDITHPHISPIYGDLKALENIHIFAGERDILFADIKKLKSLGDNKGIKINLYSHPYMNHDYVLFPLKESKLAFNEILKLL